MNPRSAPDYDALLKEYLLSFCVDAFMNPQRRREEREDARMRFEAFLLGWSDGMMEPLQNVLLSMRLDSESGNQVIAWFTEFVTSLNLEWIHRVDRNLLRFFWFATEDWKLRQQLAKLIILREMVDDPRGVEARGSYLVVIFRDSEGRNTQAPLRANAARLVEILFQFAKIAGPLRGLDQPTPGLYALRVLRYCFAEDRLLTPGELDSILQFASELTEEARRLFADIIAVA